MANHKKYVLPYAINYTVSSNGEVFNRKTERQLTIREDGRCVVINDIGYKVYIVPILEYNRIHYDNDGFNRTWSMSPEFPDYIIDGKANIFRIGKFGVSLTPNMHHSVLIKHKDGKRKRVNRFKMLAVYKLGQEDVGPVHVEHLFHNFGHRNNVQVVSDILSNTNVQILHRSLQNKEIHLLKYHKGYCLENMSDPEDIVIYECRTGIPVETRYNEVGEKVYKLPIVKIFEVGKDDEEIYDHYVSNFDVELSLEQLKLNPRYKSYNLDMLPWMHG